MTTRKGNAIGKSFDRKPLILVFNRVIFLAVRKIAVDSGSSLHQSEMSQKDIPQIDVNTENFIFESR